MQTDPPVCVLPNEVQEEFTKLYNDVSQMKTDIDSLKQMLEAVSAAHEQENTLSKELRDDVNQMKADISSLKQMLEDVSKVQTKQISLSSDLLSERTVSPEQNMLIIIVFVVLLTIVQIVILSRKIDDLKKPNWKTWIRDIIVIPTLLGGVIAIGANFLSNRSNDMNSSRVESEALLSPSSSRDGAL